MASCMCSLLFIIFVFFPASAVDPAALKIRITNRALNMLRDEARDMFQEQVAKTKFKSFQFLNWKVSNVRVTHVNVNQASLRLVENYGFKFVIKNFGFTINFDSTFLLPFIQLKRSLAFVLAGVTATMEVGLTRNKDRRLAADMRTCQASADRMGFSGTGIPRIFEETAQRILAHFVSKMFCPVFRRLGPDLVNKKLKTIPMVANVLPDAGISFDYSLTRDIRVTTTALDMSFKGQAYRQPQPPPVVGDAVEPLFTEDALMAYVGISEFFFNSASRSLYEAGIIEKALSAINSRVAQALLRIKQVFTQPLNLREALEANVGLTEAPTISITQQDGFIFNMRIKMAVISKGSGTPNTVFSLSAVCPTRIKVTVQGTRLTLLSGDVSCQLQTSNVFTRFLVAPLNSLLNNKATEFLTGWFGDGVKIPFPEGMNFTQGNIQYQNGFVVVGGDLRFTPAGRQQLVNRLRGLGR
ncbi:phospholipid transfer protein-like [Fundulus heteroclitus]|uniref:phospholipid transfer protein-like n=1 Tax=Fundulus heteroclitus TaxID=8078 RepID=UPI00165AC47C|nr:phospholipid transfer protein-like [Fundulus heteroclitus]